MVRVKVSSTNHVLIPQEIRQFMNVHAGQEVDLIAFDNQIQLVPAKPLTKMRGFLKGMDTTIEREKDRS